MECPIEQPSSKLQELDWGSPGALALGQISYETMAKALKPPPKLTVSQWADKNRFLSPEAAAEPGRWRTDRVPFMREPMDCFTDPGTERIVLMFCAQVGKTESILNAVGYMMEHAPKPVLLVQPTVDDARNFSRARISTMIRDTPALRDKIEAPKRTEGTNTILSKQFTGGGRLIFAGANSPNGLSGNPISVVCADEVDRYPPSASVDGDPVKLAEKRTTTFANRKILLTSTPTLKNLSRIEQAYRSSDRRVYKVPCPHCDHRATLKWDNVRWEEDEDGRNLPDTAAYYCENCGAGWTEADRRNAVSKGEWEATKPFKGTAGFHLNALAAPWNNVSLAKLAQEWLEAQENPTKMKAFINLNLGETYEDPGQSVDEMGLMHRREVYPVTPEGGPLIPRGVVVMTCGVDIQIDRIEAGVWGWGRGMEAWALEHHVIYGDPSGPVIWGKLGKLLIQPRDMERGGIDFIRHTCVDSGYQAQAAYEFCRPRYRYETPDGLRAYTSPIKGTIGPGHTWPREKSKTVNVPMYPIKTDAAKTAIYGAINQNQVPGPGYIHFPKFFKKPWFDQLAAERRVETIDAKGFPVHRWNKTYEGRPNEALDCAVYAYAAFQGLRFWGLNEDEWADQIERSIGASLVVDRDGGEAGEAGEEEMPRELGERPDPVDPDEPKLPYTAPPTQRQKRKRQRRRTQASGYLR